MDERDAQVDADDFAKFELEQEAEMENARVGEEIERWEGGEVRAVTVPLTTTA